MKFFLIIVTTFSIGTSKLTINPTIQSDNNGYIEEILLEHYECASYWNIVETPLITISLDTYATSFQEEQLNQSIKELNSLKLGFTYSQIDTGGMITVNFVDKDFSFFDGDNYVSLNSLQAYGYAITKGTVQPGSENCFYIDKAEVFVDKDLDDIYTSLTVFHEILHSAGFNHSSCISSMMYNKEGSPFVIPSFSNLPLDKEAFKILYSSNNTLINNEAIKEYLATNKISPDNLCKDNRYEIVSFEEKHHVCDKEQLQSPCYSTTEFITNSSTPADIWCDLTARECDDFPFKEWSSINFDGKVFYCNSESYCIEVVNFDKNDPSTQTNFEILCGDEYCEYLSNSSNDGDETAISQNDLLEDNEFDLAGILGFIIILLVLRKLYLDTLKKKQVNRVEINEDSSSFIQDFDGNFGDANELFDENDFS